MVTLGTIGGPPHGAQWWGIESWDGSKWLRCVASEKDNGREVRWWPLSDPPHLERIGDEWASGTYRLIWVERDKRKRIQVDEPFVLVDPSDPQAQAYLTQVLGPDADPHMGGAPLPGHMADVTCRCRECGRSESETPLQHFLMMWPLLNLHLERQAKLLETQHARAMEQERSSRELQLAHIKSYFEELHKMRMLENPRLLRLEEKLADMILDEDDETEITAGNPTAMIVDRLVQGLAPLVGQLAQKYMDKQQPKGLSAPSVEPDGE
jgi:hypothetical protein